MNILERFDTFLTVEGGHRIPLWRVRVDNVDLSEGAGPFRADDEKIVLFQCAICGICGLSDVSARRVEETVVWFDRPPTDDYPTGSPLGDLEGRIFAFDLYQYQSVANGGDVLSLPEMNTSELAWLVETRKLPNPNEAIYRIPESESDPNGRLALVLLREALRDPNTHWSFAPQPTSMVDLRIGLDVPGIPETFWQIGRNNERTAFRFLAYPELPFWIQSNSLDQQFGDYVSELRRVAERAPRPPK